MEISLELAQKECLKLVSDSAPHLKFWDQKMITYLEMQAPDCTIEDCKISQKQAKMWLEQLRTKETGQDLKSFVSAYKCNYYHFLKMDELSKNMTKRQTQMMNIISKLESGDLDEIQSLIDTWLKTLEEWSDLDNYNSIEEDLLYNSRALPEDSFIRCWQCNMWTENQISNCVWCDVRHMQNTTGKNLQAAPRFITLDKAILKKQNTGQFQTLIQVAEQFFGSSGVPLSGNSLSQVREALKSMPGVKDLNKQRVVVCKYEEVKITFENFQRLSNSSLDNWLSDELMAFFFKYWAFYSNTIFAKQFNHNNSNSRIRSLDMFVHTNLLDKTKTDFFKNFYERELTNKHKEDNQIKREIRIFRDYDKLLIPINPGSSHWFLACIDFRNQCIIFYNSMPDQHLKQYERLLEFVEFVWKQECTEISFPLGNIEKPTKETWSRVIHDTPQQTDCSACGVFTILYMSYIAIEKDFNCETFGQNKIDLIRAWMIHVIYNEGKANSSFGTIEKNPKRVRIEVLKNKDGEEFLTLPSSNEGSPEPGT